MINTGRAHRTAAKPGSTRNSPRAPCQGAARSMVRRQQRPAFTAAQLAPISLPPEKRPACRPRISRRSREASIAVSYDTAATERQRAPRRYRHPPPACRPLLCAAAVREQSRRRFRALGHRWPFVTPTAVMWRPLGGGNRRLPLANVLESHRANSRRVMQSSTPAQMALSRILRYPSTRARLGPGELSTDRERMTCATDI